MAISTSFTAEFKTGDPPDRALAQWRATHPDWLPERYKEISDSYNSVTWEWRHTSLMMRLVTFGGLLGGASVYRITALFVADELGGSRVTVNGTADPGTRQGIQRAALGFQEGGIV
jgi:hypothetical protein